MRRLVASRDDAGARADSIAIGMPAFKSGRAGQAHRP
jgi:hypothetical protein